MDEQIEIYQDPKTPKPLGTLVDNVSVYKEPTPDPLTGKATSLDYTRGFTPGLGASEQNFTALQQGGWDEFGNMLGQTVIGAATGAVETVSYLGDLQERISNRANEEKEYHNWLGDLMQEIKQSGKEALPVYLDEKNEGFNPASAEWWRFHGGDTIGTVLGLMVPGLGAAKLAKGVGVGKVGQTLAATLVSRTAESTMEANENFKSTYAQAIQQGNSEDAARLLASTSAAKVWNTNWLFAAQDFLQFSTLTKGVSQAAKGSTLRSIGGLATGMTSEALEEAGQFVVSKEATQSVFGGEYFGKDFTKRLSDYIEDDEFKTSMLLGAAGGGVFQGGGKIAQSILNRAKKAADDGVEIEHLALKNDTAGIHKKKDQIAWNQLLTAVSKGSIDSFIEDIKKVTDTTDPEQKQYNQDLIKEAETIRDLNAKLKTDSSVSPEVRIKTLETTFERNQLVRLTKELDTQINQTYRQLVDNSEISPELLEFKKLQLAVDAYTKLAKEQPQFKTKADEFTKNLNEAVKSPTLSMIAQMTGKPLIEAARTSKDDELKEKTFQLVTSKEKQQVLNDELKTLGTSEGKQLAKQDLIIKANNKKAQDIVNSPEATKEQLEQAAAMTAEPVVIDAINEKLVALDNQEKDNNLVDTNNTLLADTDTGLDLSPEDAFSDIDPADAAKFGIEIPTVEVPEFNIEPIAATVTILPNDVEIVQYKVGLENKQSGSPLTQIEQNTTTQTAIKEYVEKNTVKAWGKRFKGTWQETEQGREFVYDYSPTDEYINQLYWDNRTNEQVPYNKTVASTSQGIPLIDTPLVKEGDKVQLVVENDFRYTYQKGFKPEVSNVDEYIINVYRLDENNNRLDSLPITQILNANNTEFENKPNEQAINRSLRALILANSGSVITTIAGKNLGTVRRSVSGQRSTLGILENDWLVDSVRNLPYEPPIGSIDFNGKLQWKNLGQYPQEFQKELLSLETMLTTDRLPKAVGRAFTVRRTPKGDLGIEVLEGRRLTDQEITTASQKIVEVFNTKKFDSLKDLIHIQNVTSKADLVKLKVPRLARLNTMLAIPIGKSNNNTLWYVVSSKELEKVKAGQPTKAVVYSRDGESVVTAQMHVEAANQFNKLLASSFRNINFDKLNSQEQYTDISTDRVYPSYYQFLKDTSTLETNLIGSTQIGTSGQDNSYSYVQSTIHVDPNPTTSAVDVDVENQIIRSSTIEFSEPNLEPKPTVTEEELVKARRARSKRVKNKPAKVENYQFKVISSTELTWMKSHFGEEFLQVTKNIDKFIAQNGVEAFGSYVDGLVKIAEFAPEGTGYHEFGHFFLDPINGLITEKQLAKVIQEGQKIFNISNKLKVEERILEEFEKYKLSNGKYKSPITSANTFFVKLLQMIKKLLGLKTPLERLFSKIDGTILTQEQRNRILKVRKELGYIGDVKFKLAPGFIDFQQQKEAINAITSYLADSIYQVARDNNISIEEVVKQTTEGVTKIDGLFNSLLEDFKTDYTRIASLSNRTENDTYRYETYHAMGVHTLLGITNDNVEPLYKDTVGEWNDTIDETTGFKVEGFKSKVLKDFSRFGLTARNEDVEPGEDGDSESTQATQVKEQDEAERIFDQNVTMTNPSKGLSQRIRLWLHSIPVPVLDETGKVIDTEKNLFGKEVKLNFNEVDRKLKQKLSDSTQILPTLEKLAQTDPIMSVVYTKLMEEKVKDPQLFTEFMVKYNLDTINAKTILEKRKDLFDQQGERYSVYDTRVIDSNRDSTFRLLISDWKDTAVKKKVINLLDTADPKIINKLITDLTTFAEQAKTAAEKRQPFSYETYKNKLNTSLLTLGITLPTAFWANLELVRGTNPKVIEKKARENSSLIRSWLTDARNGSLLDALQDTLKGAKLFETQVIRTLAQQSAKYATTEGGAGTYISEDGTQRNSINLGSFITNWGNTIKSGSSYATDLMRDTLYSKNRLLQLINDKTTVNKIDIVEIEASRENNKDAKMFSDRTKTDSILARFNAFFYQKVTNEKESSIGIYYLPTPADKSKNPGIILPKKNSTDAEAFLESILLDTTLAEAERIRIITEQNNLRSELTSLQSKQDLTDVDRSRIIELSYILETVLLSDVENLNTKGLSFQYLPELNQNTELVNTLIANISKGDKSSKEYIVAHNNLTNFIKTWVANYYTKFEDFLVEENIIKKITTEKGVTLKNNKLPKGIVGSSPSTQTISSFLKQFLFNDTAWQLEMSKVFMGDLALYKNSDDYFKRAYQLVTPGYKGYEDVPSIVVRGIYPKQIKTNTISQLTEWAKGIDSSITEEQVQNYLDTGKTTNPTIEVISKYLKVNKTDAQTYADITTYRTLADSLGQWSREQESLYQLAWKDNLPARVALKLKKDTLTDDQYKKLESAIVTTIITPLKPFQFNDVELDIKGNTKYIKEQIKDSISPLIPDLYYEASKGNPSHKGLRDLHNYMSNHGIGLMSAVDTSKVGTYGVLDLSASPQPWQLRKTQISNLRYPQLLPSKVKDKTSGSQFHKFIMGNIADDTMYSVGAKSITGSKLKELYNDYWVEKLEQSSTRLQNILGVGPDYTYSADKEIFEKQILKLKQFLDDELSSRDLDENYIDSLTLVRDTLYGVDFTNPLSFPQLGEKLQGILTNIFKREVIKQKSPGYVAVNMADFGILKSDELQYIKVEDTIQAAEIGLSIDYIKDIGLQYGKHIQPNGRINWDQLNTNQQEALEFIAYRIPTSSKSSMLPVRIALILPQQMRGIVMLPGETTIQMGLDFDVDKTQLLRRVLSKEGQVDKENVDNKLFDLYWSILSNKAHLLEMITPLATDTLEDIRDDYTEMGLFDTVQFPVFSMVSNVNTENKNKEEKAKVGITSKASTAHSVLQNIEPESRPVVRFGILYNSQTGVALGNTLDMDGNYISANLGQTQQAALDAAKTPLLALFNISKDYTAYAESMLMAGYPLRVVTDFFMQSIIREFVTLYNQSDRRENVALDEIYKKYPELKTIIVQRSLPIIQAEALTVNITKPVTTDLNLNAAILWEFLQGSQQAKSMATLTTVLSIDTYDDLTSIEAIQSLQHSINKLTSNEGGIMLPASLLDVTTAPSSTKRLATFIKLGLENALKFTQQFYPSVDYGKYHEFVSQQLGINTITDKQSLKTINQFINYYQLNQNNTLEQALLANHPLTSVEPKKAHYSNRWSYVKQDYSIIDYLNKTLNEVKDEQLLNNPLIRNLRPKQNPDGILLLGVNNTGTDKNKTDLINGFDDLLNYDDIRVRTLAHDLARYAIQTSGMGFSPFSFVNLIPVSFFVENGLSNYWRTKLKASNFEVDPTSLFLNLLRNKAEQIKGVPVVYDFLLDKQSKVVVKGITESFNLNATEIKRREQLPTILIYNENLYEHSPYKQGAYKLLQKYGEQYFTEVSATGRSKSRLDNVGSPDPWNTESGIIDAEKTREYNFSSDELSGEENELVVKYVPAGSTMNSILDQLIAEETNTDQLKVLNLLRENADKLKSTIEVKSIPGKLGEFSVTDTGVEITSTISINPFATTDSAEVVKRVLLHEILHGFTVEVLNNPQTTQEINFNTNIERLVKDAKTKLGEIQGTQNKFEFIAELGSNPEFRSKLRKQDLWSRIIRNIRRLVGMTDSYDQLLNQMYEIVDKAQSLQPTTLGTYNLEKKEKPSKFADSIQSMLASLQAELTNLRAKGLKIKAGTLQLELKRLTKLAEDNRIATKMRYFLYVDKQLKLINNQLTKFSKNAELATAENIQIIRNQILSYDNLLGQFYLDMRNLPDEEFTKNKVNKDTLLTQVTTLRNEMFRAKIAVEGLYKDKIAQVIKEQLPDEDLQEIRNNLEIADRDIHGWSQLTRSLVDMADPILKAVGLKLQAVVRAAYREMSSILTTQEESSQTARYAYKETTGIDVDGEPIDTWTKKAFKYTRIGKLKALREYEAWRGSTSTIADKYAPVIDQASKRLDSDEIRFINPLSTEGQRILTLPKGAKDYPLRQFYENFVLDYLQSQEVIKLPSQRPGLRIPTISKSLLEGMIDYKTNPSDLATFIGDKFKDQFRERTDDLDYARVNQNLQPASSIPIRFSAKQDGKDGHYTKEQVSLDIATSTLLFQHQMLEYKGKQEIQAEVELARDAVKQRQVIKTRSKSYLSGEVEGIAKEGGGYVMMEGAASNTFKALDDVVERDLYGKRKKVQKGARIADFVTKVSGFNIMFGNVAIPITNAFMGNFALLTEAVGGNIISAKNLWNGHKLYSKNILAYGKDFGKRANESEIGKLLAYFNPLDQHRLIDSTGINGQFLRDSWSSLMSTGGDAVNHQLAVTVMGAVMDRFKVTDKTGKEVAFNEGVTVNTDGKLTLKPGFKYKGKTTIANQELDKLLQYTLRTFHLTSGVYNQMDEGTMNRDFIGRLVSFMRRWLPAGLDARYRRRFKDDRLDKQYEGHYVSAAIAFNRIFAENGYINSTLQSIRLLLWGGVQDPKILLLPDELELSQEQQEEIIELRKANIRKTLFQLYSIALLSLMLFAGDDDEDSYVEYLAARVRREMMTFIDPTTAWDVLRSPSVVMQNIQNIQKAVNESGKALWDVSVGDGEVDIKERGKGKGMPKWLYESGKLVGANSLYQFDDLETSTRLIQDGGFR